MHTDMRALLEGFDVPDLRPAVREDPQDAWTAARDEALLAYREWYAASELDQEHAYYVYLAAADREEAAALHLQRHLLGDAVICASLPAIDNRMHQGAIEPL
jgi:hypothetical protein